MFANHSSRADIGKVPYLDAFSDLCLRRDHVRYLCFYFLFLQMEWSKLSFVLRYLNAYVIAIDYARWCGLPDFTTFSGSFSLNFSRNSRSSVLFLRSSGSITGISSMIG